MLTFPFDAKLDLILERTVDLKPEEIWKAWTTPEILKKWFCPKPWSTVDAKMDLRPGGIFHSVMQSPEGQQFPNTGCFLEVIPNKKLVWTSSMTTDFRPQLFPEGAGFPMTAMIILEPKGTGTLYRAVALHADEQARRQHADMGFEQGWGMSLDQLIETMKALR